MKSRAEAGNDTVIAQAAVLFLYASGPMYPMRHSLLSV
jgi:hypothetical protein